MKKTFELKSVVTEYSSINDLDETNRKLVEKSKEISHKAYAPYSKFKVGCAALLANGQIVTGNNQENVAFPSGLCAERVALFYANAVYPDQAIIALAVCANIEGNFTREPVYPCGACRQVILETENRYDQPIRIYFYGENKIQEVNSIRQLLPLTFDSLK